MVDRNQRSSSTADDNSAASPATTFDSATTSDWQRLSSPLGQLAQSAPTARADGGDDWGDWLDEVVDGIADARHGSDDTDVIDASRRQRFNSVKENWFVRYRHQMISTGIRQRA